MRLFLAAALLLVANTARAEEERWLLYGVTGGGGRVVRGGEGGGISHGGVRYRVSRSWWIDASTGEGFFTPPDEVMGHISAGARVEASELALRPSLYVGFAHGHEIDMEHAKHEPAQSLFATSEHMRHRTGLAAGVGITSPSFRIRQNAKWGVVLLARGSATWFGDTHDTPLYLFGDVGLGVTF